MKYNKIDKQNARKTNFSAKCVFLFQSYQIIILELLYAISVNIERIIYILLLDSFAETSNGRSDSNCARRVQRVRATGLDLVTRTAPPNTNSLTLDCIFTAEVTEILRVLRNLLLLDNFTEGGPVTRSVFTGDTCLLFLFVCNQREREQIWICQ